MSDKMIVIENLVKKFQNTVILDHINISFEKGKIYESLDIMALARQFCLNVFADL